MTKPWMAEDVIAPHHGVTQDIVYSWIVKKFLPALPTDRLWNFKVTEVDVAVCNEGTVEASERNPMGIR